MLNCKIINFYKYLLIIKMDKNLKKEWYTKWYIVLPIILVIIGVIIGVVFLTKTPEVKKCTSNCSGNGTCDSSGICTCNSGYTGTDCAVKKCPTNNPSLVCSGNGTCDSSGICTCKSGYTGADCAALISSCSAPNKMICSGEGQCTNAKCVCNAPVPLKNRDPNIAPVVGVNGGYITDKCDVYNYGLSSWPTAASEWWDSKGIRLKPTYNATREQCIDDCRANPNCRTSTQFYNDVSTCDLFSNSINIADVEMVNTWQGEITSYNK